MAACAPAADEVPPTQSPNLFTLGPAAAFMKQAPFTV